MTDAERRAQEFEHTKDTLDGLNTNVDAAENELKRDEDQVDFPEDKLSEESCQLVETDAASSGYWECVVIFEKNSENVLAEVKCLPEQHTVDNDLIDVIHTALALHKTASQQNATADAKDHAKLLVHKAASDAEFRKFRKDIQARVE